MDPWTPLAPLHEALESSLALRRPPPGIAASLATLHGTRTRRTVSRRALGCEPNLERRHCWREGSALGMANQPAPYTAKQQGLIDKIRALFSQERWEELNRMDVNEVLEVAEELRCQPTQQDACHPAVGMLLLLARSFESVSRHSEAIGLTEKAKAFASDVGDQVGLKDSARDLGIFYSKVGRYNDAINVH